MPPVQHGRSSCPERMEQPREEKSGAAAPRLALHQRYDEAEAYEYFPLQPQKKEIRVLVLSPGSWDDPIEGTMERGAIHPEPVNGYETVSYAWGDAMSRLSINIDGYALYVPANTVAALRRIRLQDQPRRIWIDAVCIDQQNVDERNHQVAMMRDVYGNGTRNLIYLGEATPQTARAPTDSLSAISADIRTTTGGESGLYDILFDAQGIFQYDRAGLRCHVDLDALQVLFSAPWFSRLWVMQEATVSRVSICLFGEEIITLRQVTEAAIWSCHKHSSLPSDLMSSPGVKDGAELWSFVDPQGQEHVRGGASIASALTIAKNLTTSEPRDSVYGALGLMECVRDAGKIPSLLYPDYRRKLADVCRDATRAAIYEDEGRHCRDLFGSISHRCAEDLEDSGWPSWVPRWYRSWEQSLDSSRLAQIFSADGRRALPHLNPHDMQLNELFLAGNILDSVSGTFTPLELDQVEDWTRFKAWVSAAISFLQGKDHTHNEAEISKVLIAGTNFERQPSESADYLSMWDSITDKYGNNAAFGHPSLPEAHREAQRFRAALNQACNDRRLFHTSEGCLGLGPKVLKSGDQVAVLCGFSTPFILRQHVPGNTFKIVGKAYLEGAMYGDVYSAIKAAGKPDEDFVLV